MLRPSVLKSILEQANSGGIQATLLLNREGSLVSYVGLHPDQARIKSAIASNIWSSYERSSLAAKPAQSHPASPPALARDDPGLSYVLIDCEQGVTGLAAVGNTDLILLCIAQKSCEIGMLKKKLLTLVDALHTPLAHVAHQTARPSGKTHPLNY